MDEVRKFNDVYERLTNRHFVECLRRGLLGKTANLLPVAGINYRAIRPERVRPKFVPVARGKVHVTAFGQRVEWGRGVTAARISTVTRTIPSPGDGVSINVGAAIVVPP